MKKITMIFVLLLAAGSLMAQRNVETVYLNNGSIIKGEIVEQVPNESIKIRTKDGSLFVYRMDEIQKITKESSAESTQNTGHRGLDFSIDLGYNVGKGSGMFSAEAGLGKRFNKNFYWGIGTGVFLPNEGDAEIPFTTDFRVYFPLANTKIVPMAGLKLGYVLNLAEDYNVQVEKNKWTKVEIPDFYHAFYYAGLSDSPFLKD